MYTCMRVYVYVCVHICEQKDHSSGGFDEWQFYGTRDSPGASVEEAGTGTRVAGCLRLYLPLKFIKLSLKIMMLITTFQKDVIAVLMSSEEERERKQSGKA